MRMSKTLVILATLFAGTAAMELDAGAIEEFVGDLWTQSDTDESGELSQAEFTTAAEKVGIEASIFTQHGQSYATFWADLDTDNSGGVSPAEFAASVSRFPSYQDPIIAAFTNGLSDIEPTVPDPPDLIKEAQATVSASLQVSGSPESIYAGQRAEILQFFATTAGVTTDAVLLTFLVTSADRRRKLKTLSKRELQSMTTTVEATIFVEDAADAASIADSLEAVDPTTDPAFAGLSVVPGSYGAESSPTVPPLPITNLAITAAALLFLGLFLCVNAKFWSGKRAKAKRADGDTTPPGCCSTGCCSFNAVKPWAFGELTAAGAILGTVFYLYTQITDLADALLGLLDVLLQLLVSSVPQIQDFATNIPSDVVDTLRDNRSNFDLLPVAVMVPGILAAVFLLLGALCPAAPAHKGSYCCTKLVIMLANVFLLVALIFYIIFAAFAVVIGYAPVAAVEEQIGTLRGYCQVLPAQYGQMYSDAQLLIAKLSSSPAASSLASDIAEMQTTLDDVEVLVNAMTGGCLYLNAMIDELLALFLPGVMCVVAILYAYFVNNTLCCAAGCCKGPPTGPIMKKSVETTSSGENLVNV